MPFAEALENDDQLARIDLAAEAGDAAVVDEPLDLPAAYALFGR